MSSPKPLENQSSKTKGRAKAHTKGVKDRVRNTRIL